MNATLGEFSERRNFPYMQGIYLGVNALADAVLVVDGPDCVFFMNEHVFGSHDLRSTLLDVGGRHRVTSTRLHVDRVIHSHDDLVLGALRQVRAAAGTGAALLGAMPMAAITGVDYDGLARQVVREQPGPPVFVVPARSLDRDWLDGYADLLRSVALGLDLGEPAPHPDKVALVGYFKDRNEEDHEANLRELRRLTGALGLELVSVWLDGGPLAGLQRVREAGHVVALPHGLQAAQVLARRTGARLTALDLPLGPDATDRFVRGLGAATGRVAQAEAAVDAGHALLARRWEWLVPRRLLDRRLAFYGDPHLMPGLAELCRHVGAQLPLLVAYGRRKPGFERGGARAAALGVEPLWEPRDEELRRVEQAADVELVIGNTWALQRWSGRGATLEFGFPSRDYHCCFDAPFLGYAGALCLVDRISNALGDRCVHL